MEHGRLAGRKALVTGGARGIGASVAHALARAGADVVIGDVLVELAAQTAQEIARTGGRTGSVALDVSDDAQWTSATEAVVAQMGGFDILVNNAGIEITSLVADLQAADLRRMCDINVVGVGLGLKHAFRAMRPGGRGRCFPRSTRRTGRIPAAPS